MLCRLSYSGGRPMVAAGVPGADSVYRRSMTKRERDEDTTTPEPTPVSPAPATASPSSTGVVTGDGDEPAEVAEPS